jgi:hypothetical protein
MAKVSAVLDTLAMYDGRVERPTMDVFVRELRGTERLPPSKRGFGAVGISPRDAACLLIATRLTESPARSSRLIDRYLAMPRAGASHRVPPVPSLRRTAESTRFGEAIGMLIEDGLSLERDLARTGAVELRLEIRQQQIPQAVIRWFDRNGVECYSVGWGYGAPQEAPTDRVDTAQITHRTIIALAHTLAGAATLAEEHVES